MKNLFLEKKRRKTYLTLFIMATHIKREHIISKTNQKHTKLTSRRFFIHLLLKSDTSCTFFLLVS